MESLAPLALPLLQAASLQGRSALTGRRAARLRPPLSRERIHLLPDGRVRWALKRPWSDGTTSLLFTPEEFVERLVALIPPARANTIVYHGIFASQAKGRGQFLPRPSPRRRPKVLRLSRPDVCNESSRWTPWAELLLRVFGVDRVACPHCGQAMALRTVVVRPPATTRVLRSLSRSAENEGGRHG